MKTPSYLLLRAIIASQFAITYLAAQGNLADWSDEVTDGGIGALADQTTFSIAAVPGASLFFRIGEL